MEIKAARSPPESLSYAVKSSAALAIGGGGGVGGRGSGRGGATGHTNGALTQAMQTSSDVRHMVDTLTSRGVLPSENVLVCTAQSDYDQCASTGIRDAFKQQISKVAGDGLFVFAYSGPAVMVAPSTTAPLNCSLQPVDFNPEDVTTHITAATVGEWLANAPTKPKHVLLIMDAPLAGVFGAEMTDVDKHRPSGDYSLCVISATNGPEKPFVVDTLAHSIFTYFLSWAFRTTPFTPGLIPLKTIFTKAKECCNALSSLIVTYDSEIRKLTQKTATPTANYTIPTRVLNRLESDSDETDGNRLESDSDETDGVGAIGRFEFLLSHYSQGKGARKIKVHEKVNAFLETVAALTETSSLGVLNKHGLLQEEVLTTVVCALMLSIASIQVAAEVKKSLSDPILFIFSFITSAAAVSAVKHDVELAPVDLFRRSREYYMQVVRENRVEEKKLVELFRKVDSDTKVAK